MKSVQSEKLIQNNINMKSKKNSKEREKRSSSSSQQENDRGPPAKDCKKYSGINSESIYMYIEQMTCDGENSVLISKAVCNVLKEDINYKLRYVIQDALIKARVCGRNVILSKDIEETFQNLTIDKVYGAAANPSWVTFGDQNLLHLDDSKLNLIDIAEEEVTYAQHGTVTLVRKWSILQEDASQSPAFRNYFITMCHAVISNEDEVRRIALKDISENPKIGPITEWFYHFGYFLLMKDVTYDCLTIFALDLIETLENSPLNNTTVSVRQLKLLVRLLLQRLLIAIVSQEILKPMCSTLALLCLREPLKQMVITKINQKLGLIDNNVILPVLTAVYFLGLDAVESIFLPNLEYFMFKMDLNNPEIVNILLAIYGLICKTENACPIPSSIPNEKREFEIGFVAMKAQLLKTRRRVDCNLVKKNKIDLENIFEIPSHDCMIRNKILQHRSSLGKYRKETHVIVGKNSLLLSVLKGDRQNKFSKKCTGHLLYYNI